MKVYQINSVCGFGSTGRIALDLAQIIRDSGSQCRIGYGRGMCPAEDTFRFESDLQVRIHGLMSRITDRQGFYSSGATRKLITDIRDYAPDIIHLHNIHGYYLNVKLLFSFLAQYGKPVVWTLHDCWPFTGHCAYFDHSGCGRWRTGCHHCPQKKEYPASVLADASRENYAQKQMLFTQLPNLTIVTPSQWLADLARCSFLGKHDIVTIPNGIDLSVFRPEGQNVRQRFQLGEGPLVLGVANVWEERKGLQDFLLLREFLPQEYIIILTGLSAPQCADLPAGIRGISRAESTQELVHLYSEASVYVNPTYEDNFPTTNLEALACGTPVITYDTGGSPEALTPDCGTVVTKTGDRRENAKALAEAVKAACFDSTLCRARAKQFDKNIQFSRYLELYSKCLRG